LGLQIVDRPSPNHNARPDGVAVDMLVLHYTGMKTAEEALARLCDPAAQVSAHYTVDETGCVYRHVAEERRAWHSGVSYWAGRAGVNDCSIGIELVNPGHELGYVPFTDDQIAALIDLAQDIVRRHSIPQARVLGHSDVAPARKTDPGELFPWKHLADFGIGAWPQLAGRPRCGVEERVARAPVGDGAAFARNLARFGYGIAPEADVPLEAAIAAFQRHFRPSCIDGVADAECAALLDALLAQ
jgi:N-acetylmuramoyl-L-alanine amidase